MSGSISIRIVKLSFTLNSLCHKSSVFPVFADRVAGRYANSPAVIAKPCSAEELGQISSIHSPSVT